MPVLRQPILWRVTDHTTGAVDAILLGDQPDDSYRVSVTVVGGRVADAPEVDAQVVYPCRACGWADDCDGECHS